MAVVLQNNQAQSPHNANNLHVLPEEADDAMILSYILQQPNLVGCHHPLAKKIANIIALPLYDMGKMLVRVRLDSQPNLQIMIENIDGRTINVDDCSQVSHAISAILDVEDPIDKRYRLEISSTGIDRPLTRLQDFTRYIGEEIKIELVDAMLIAEHQQRKFNGLLENMDGDNLIICYKAQSINIPISMLKTAKLVLTDALLQQNLNKE